MRILFCAALLLAAVIGLSSSAAIGQPAAAPKADPKFKAPAVVRPDAATMKIIAEKTKTLTEAVAALQAKKIPDDVLVEVDIYRKAAEYIVKFDEWYTANAVKWTLTTLDRGLERAKQAEGGKAPWREQTGQWVVRAYRSNVDGSVQPYAVLLPESYGKDSKKKWRLDVVLHGRDSSISEAKFIANHDGAMKAPKDNDFVQLEVYGRGNNAYRWAGEMDVREAAGDFGSREIRDKVKVKFDVSEPYYHHTILRGFSMGGAGTWHIGLHRPFAFAVIGPGAGFSTTHGYIKNLPNPLPDYQEKCLRIYDAVRYAENAYNVPIVAYSGENDAQKAAADNIENALKTFPKKVRFTHLIAPGLEHKMPPEWQARAQTEYQKAMSEPKSWDRIHFVTYTTRYSALPWGSIEGLERHYERSLVEGEFTSQKLVLRTENIRVLHLENADPKRLVPEFFEIDGQRMKRPDDLEQLMRLTKLGGHWSATAGKFWRDERPLSKHGQFQGPIDDAFMKKFVAIAPNRDGWNDAVSRHANASLKRFSVEWEKYFRGTLPTATNYISDPSTLFQSLVLFGDPQSNPLIAKIIDKLPITWTKEKLVVDGVEYDPKTHVPVLIYPNPLNPHSYVVLNSGHTFHAADFQGTNALLYPRLGDWAVLKPKPTPEDPAAAEVVAAGLFDENWQFPKPKK